MLYLSLHFQSEIVQSKDCPNLNMDHFVECNFTQQWSCIANKMSAKNALALWPWIHAEGNTLFSLHSKRKFARTCIKRGQQSCKVLLMHKVIFMQFHTFYPRTLCKTNNKEYQIWAEGSLRTSQEQTGKYLHTIFL